MPALKARRPAIRFVQFVDGDCILVDGWLDKALAFFEQRNDTAIVCGRRLGASSDGISLQPLCDLEWDTPPGETWTCGGDALVRVNPSRQWGDFGPI